MCPTINVSLLRHSCNYSQGKQHLKRAVLRRVRRQGTTVLLVLTLVDKESELEINLLRCLQSVQLAEEWYITATMRTQIEQ